MTRSLWQYAALLLVFLSVAFAAKPTSFCKWYADIA